MTDALHDSAGQQVLPVDLTHVGSTAQTARDIAADLKVLSDLKKGALNADDLTAETANVLKEIAHLYGFAGTTWNRLRANLNTGTMNLHNTWALVVQAALSARLDGSNTKELDCRTTDSDNVTAGLAALVTMGHLYGFDGTTWDRIRAALTSSAANLNEINALVTASVLHARTSGSTVEPLDARSPIWDGQGSSMKALTVLNYNMRKNGGGEWDAERNNAEFTILASATRTADTDSADMVNYNAKGVIIWLDVTANPGGGETLTPKLFYRPAGGGTANILASFAAHAAANSQALYLVYPGQAAGGDDRFAAPVPRTWYLGIDHSAAGSWTYSVKGCYVP